MGNLQKQKFITFPGILNKNFWNILYSTWFQQLRMLTFGFLSTRAHCSRKFCLCLELHLQISILIMLRLLWNNSLHVLVDYSPLNYFNTNHYRINFLKAYRLFLVTGVVAHKESCFSNVVKVYNSLYDEVDDIVQEVITNLFIFSSILS